MDFSGHGCKNGMWDTGPRSPDDKVDICALLDFIKIYTSRDVNFLECENETLSKCHAGDPLNVKTKNNQILYNITRWSI